MSESDNWIRVAALAEVAKGTAVPAEIMGLSLAVYHLEDGTVWVTDNECTHAYALLTDGWLENGVIECPLHAGQFDVRTGKGMGAPIDTDLRVYKTRVVDGAIMIEMPA